MLLKIGKEEWHLHFLTREVAAPPKGPVPLWRSETICKVHTGPCIMTYQKPTYCVNGRTGMAKCSRKDQFNRRVGHRLALTKALEGLPELTRKIVWDAYWLRVRRPKESPIKFRQRLQRSVMDAHTL